MSHWRVSRYLKYLTGGKATIASESFRAESKRDAIDKAKNKWKDEKCKEAEDLDEWEAYTEESLA